MNAQVQLPGQTPQADITSPFSLDNHQAYAAWRIRKLTAFESVRKSLWVDIADLNQPDDKEIRQIIHICDQANMAFYRSGSPAEASKDSIRRLVSRLGMHRLDANLCADHDSISSIQVMQQGRHAGYIPYTDRPLNWHTDGYYNPPDQPIRAFLMHCIRPAAEGGENRLLDTDIAYILLRDEDPEFVTALMHPQAMTIPANVENGRLIRPPQAGPVFCIDSNQQTLSMRYTARTRSIIWRDDPATQGAMEFLHHILREDNPYVVGVRLAAGEGVICNNVIHCRSAFSKAANSTAQRLLYRARSYDRIHYDSRS